MTGAMVVRWKGGYPGRETQALQTFGKALAYYEQLAKQGRIHAHHEYFSLTGQSGGFAIVEGQVEELLKIQTEEETLRLNAEAQVNVDGFAIDTYVGGSDASVQKMVGIYGETLQGQGLMP